MSFVNLLANDIWSEVDIINRTEAMIAAEYPAQIAGVLSRKVTAATLGAYTLTDEEKQHLVHYTDVCVYAAAEGVAARQDMALLLEVVAYEANPELELSPAAQAVYNLRHPEVPNEA